MRRFRNTAAALVLALGLAFAASAPAFANPGPGNSFQCAPGQHDGTGSNANATDHCGPNK